MKTEVIIKCGKCGREADVGSPEWTLLICACGNRIQNKKVKKK